MELTELAGYILGMLIGVAMGLIGGGGSLLLPIFLYLFDVDIELATGYTLLLVGLTAGVGVMLRRGRGEIDLHTGIELAIPVLFGTMLARGAVYLVPDELFAVGNWIVTKQMVVLAIFAIVLGLSFASMKGLIGKGLSPRPSFRKENPKRYYPLVITLGLCIGLLSGCVGAGGGVLIVPLLVVIVGMPMHTVVGTSLAIMTFKSLLGFLVDVGFQWEMGESMQWGMLTLFAASMFLGILIGSLVGRRIRPKHLREGFAWFILAMAIFILVKEFGFPDSA